MIRIAFVEDDQLVREITEKFLQEQEEIEFVSSFISIEDFLKNGSFFPVMLLDIKLPGMSGLEGIFHIKQKYPNTEILMLTMYDDKDSIFQALRAGAGGYLLKNSSLPTLKASIFELLVGGAPMSPAIAKKVVAYFAELVVPAGKYDLYQLTAREKEVAVLLIEGNSYKQVAYYLKISMDTVRHHIKNIYRKLQINSRTQLMREFGIH